MNVTSYSKLDRLNVKMGLMLILLLFCLFASSNALAEVTYTNLKVTDVTPQSFTVNWKVDEPSTAGINVYLDVNKQQVATGAIIDLQFTESNNAALATTAEDDGVLRARVSGLSSDTAYFYEIVSTPKSTGIPLTFPLSGALPSVKTLAKSIPVSNESLGANTYQTDGATAADGTILILNVNGSQYGVSHMVGDGYSASYAALNLSNLYDDATGSNRTILGGETGSIRAFGGLLGQTVTPLTVPTSTSTGEMILLTVSPLTLQADIDSDADLMSDIFEIENGLSVGTNDAGGDPDNDNLSNLEEYRAGTNPNIADSDGDGISDGDEVNVYHTLPNQRDTDQDGISDGDEILSTNTDPLNADTDGDGASDGYEILNSTNPNDNTDTPVIDTDQDGVPDSTDNCPLLPNPDQLDTDGDSIGNICDSDDDNDGIPDSVDNSPLVANPGQEDVDNDGVGDASDNCVNIKNSSQSDNDNDGIGDVCDPDDDNDGINDMTTPPAPSNLPFQFTSFNSFVETSIASTIDPQAYISVGKYDISTTTLVTIGFFNLTTRTYTPMTLTPAEQSMTGTYVVGIDNNNCLCVNVKEGDYITIDTGAGKISAVLPAISATSPITSLIFVSEDGSTYTTYTGSNSLSTLIKSALVPQPLDNCQFIPNPDQLDTDGDGIGDVCDITADDLDGDGVPNNVDNCPTTHNPDQADFDGDSIGDACDPDDDNDGLSDVVEAALGTNPLSADSDSDGISDGQEDSDFDGISNMAEVAAGTSPTVPDVVLRKGLNLFNYPGAVPGGTTAYSLLSMLGGDGVIQKIQRYNPSSGTFDTAEYSAGVQTGLDFPIVTDEGYYVTMKQDMTLPLVGSLSCDATNANSGINLIGFSCIPQGTTAFGAMASLGGYETVSAIQHFNKNTGRFETASFDGNGNSVGIDFPIINTESYIVNMKGRISNLGFVSSMPSLTITSHSDGQVVNSPSITVSGIVSDVNSHVTVNGVTATIDNSSGSPVFTAPGIGLVEGLNTITITVLGSNNLKLTKTISITLATPPLLTVSLPVDGETTHAGLYKVEGTISDPLATIDVNGVAATISGNNYTADVPLSVGSNTITVTATGSNTAVSTDTVTATYQPVQITIQAGTSYSGSADIITTPEVFDKLGSLSYSYNTPSLMTYTTDNFVMNSPQTIQVNYTIGTDITELPGTYSFSAKYQFKDATDNTIVLREESIDFIVTVTVPSAPPVVTVISPSDGDTVTSSPITLTGTVSDPASTVTVNGVAATVVGTDYSASVDLVDGANTITIDATNSFGTTEVVITVTLDTTLVIPDVTVAAGGSVTGLRQVVTTTSVFDAVTGGGYYYYTVTASPALLTFTDAGVGALSPDTFQENYTVDADATIAPGTYTISVTYSYFDSTDVNVLTDSFDVIVEVTP